MAQNLTVLMGLLASTVGGDMKANSAAIAENVQKRGDLQTLSTNHKSTIVGALNELKTGLEGVDLTALINDGDVSATDSTLSASKVTGLIATAKDEILGGAGAAFDTLQELQTALQNNPDIITGIQESLAKRVRVDAVQDFTAPEKATGRGNIGAASDADLTTLENGVGDYESADFVAQYVTARDAA